MPLDQAHISQMAADPRTTAVDFIAYLKANDAPATSMEFEKFLAYYYTLLASLRHTHTAYDVGAHTGYHSVPLAQLYARLVCFEPLPHIRARLAQTMAAYPNTTVRGEALSNKSGQSTFVVNTVVPQESGIIQRVYSNPQLAQTEEITVTLATLDQVRRPDETIGYIKIDAEGGEIDILRGGLDTLRRDRPYISVEYGAPSYAPYGHTQTSLRDVAQEAGYRVYDIFGFDIHPIDIYTRTVGHYYWDFLLIPAEDTRAIQLMEQGRQHLLANFQTFVHNGAIPYLHTPNLRHRGPRYFATTSV